MVKKRKKTKRKVNHKRNQLIHKKRRTRRKKTYKMKGGYINYNDKKMEFLKEMENKGRELLEQNNGIPKNIIDKINKLAVRSPEEQVKFFKGIIDKALGNKYQIGGSIEGVQTDRGRARKGAATNIQRVWRGSHARREAAAAADRAVVAAAEQEAAAAQEVFIHKIMGVVASMAIGFQLGPEGTFMALIFLGAVAAGAAADEADEAEAAGRARPR
jgi:hypothetical protein